jgi:hypothetical protein
MQEDATMRNISINTYPGILGYKLQVYHQQDPLNGTGQAGIFTFRTRSGQMDGTGYGQNDQSAAIKGVNFWGDPYSFGLAG